jgi:hypothetical protein
MKTSLKLILFLTIFFIFKVGSTQTDLKPFDRIISGSDTLILLTHEALKSANLAHSERVILRQQVDSLNKVVYSCLDQVERYKKLDSLRVQELKQVNLKVDVLHKENNRLLFENKFFKIVTSIAVGWGVFVTLTK